MVIIVLQDGKWETSRWQLSYLVLFRLGETTSRLIGGRDSCWRMVMVLSTGRQREEKQWIREVVGIWRDIHRGIQG